MNKENVLKIIISITVPLLVGFVGSYFTSPAITGWYADLNKPEFNPPNWIFAPVWTVLYVFMGVAFFLVWKIKEELRKNTLAVIFFGVQLFLNSTWSIVFFAMQSPGVALINIVLLWFALLATVVLFYKVDKRTVYFLVPYLLWVTFATYLNYQIFILNQL